MNCKSCGGVTSQKYCASCLGDRRQAKLDAANAFEEDEEFAVPQEVRDIMDASDDSKEDYGASQFPVAALTTLGNLSALLPQVDQAALHAVQEDVAQVIEDAIDAFEEAGIEAGLFTEPVWLQRKQPKNVDIMRRKLASTHAKRLGISIERLMDTMDGKVPLSADREVAKLLKALEPQMLAIQENPKDKARKQYTKKKIRFSHRRVTSLREDEVLFILIWTEQEREVARKVGEEIAGRKCTEADKKDRVVLMDVDKDIWLSEPLRHQK